MVNVKKIVSDAISEYTKGNYDVALVKYKQTLKHASYNDLGIIYYNIGLCHFSMFNYKAAEVSFEKSFDVYGYLHSGYELCMSKLFNGKLVDGMKLYKYRYYGIRNTFPNLPIQKVDTIEQCKGKRVLVLNEEGFGDEIMFSRAIPNLSNSALSVSYQVYDKMLSLFENTNNGLYSNVSFFTNRSLSLEFVMDFDCWITTGDLFSDHLINNGMSHIPFKTNNTLDQFLDIGVTWSANNLSASAKMRSLNINDFKEALQGENTTITSLQFGEKEEWMESRDISDFNKTFDVISKLDLVVSVDTVTAHLAGMMGKPTILVYDKYLDWRWVYDIYTNVTIVHISELKTYMSKIHKEFK